MEFARHKKGPLARIAFELGEAEFDYSNWNVCHGGSGGSSGGGTTTTTSQPPAQVLAAYQTATNAAQTAASQPLQQYNGATVAGFTPDQLQAFQTVAGTQGAYQPYLNSASSNISAGTTPLWNNVQQFSPDAVQQYASPYTQNVLNTTMAAENNQDAQQQNQLVGNAISSGAWGGDRSAVAQAQLAGQQAIANNATNANIENTGYNTALGEFNTQQQNQLGANEANAYLNEQAGALNTNLAGQATNLPIQQASAQLQSGALQQQLGQEVLNVPYEQFLQQQAYPFQTSQFFTNTAEGLSGQGGTSSTTAPGASTASTLAGLGIGGLGVAGAALAADGGRIQRGSGGLIPQFRRHRDSGGGLPAVPDLSISYIPSSTGFQSAGMGIPKANQSTSQQPSQQSGTSPTGLVGAGVGAYKTGQALSNYIAGQMLPDAGTAFTGAAGATDAANTAAFLGNTSPAIGASGIGADATGLAPTFTSLGNVGSLANETAGTDAIANAGLWTPATASLDSVAAADPAATASFLGGADSAGGLGSFLGSIGDAGTAALSALSDWGAAAGDAIGSAAVDAGSWLADAALAAFAFKDGGKVPRFDAGGGISPITGAQPAQFDSGPYAQNAYKQISQLPLDKLQELQLRAPPGTAQGALIQQAIKQKQFMPNASQPTATVQAPQAGTQLQNPMAPQAGLAGGGRLRRDDGGDIPDPGELQRGLDLQQEVAAEPANGPPQAGFVDTGAQVQPPAQPTAPQRAEANPWLALAAAGFGMAAGNSPNIGVNAGRGALEGLQNYGEQQKVAQESTKMADQVDQWQKENAIKQEALQQGKYDIKSDAMGNMYKVNTRTGDVEPIKGAGLGGFGTPAPMQNGQATATGTQTGQSDSAGNPTGDAFLSALPPQIGAQVKALAEGRMQFPGGFALKSPYWQQMLSAVSQYDPTFDAVNYNARSGTRKDFTSGKDAASINALNTVAEHMGQLQDAIPDLNNTSWQAANSVKNWAKTQAGSPDVTNFDAIKNSVASELVRVWRGTGGNESDIQGRLKDLSDSNSPQQLQGVLTNMGGLIKGKIDALQDQYKRGMGTAAEDKNFYTPQAQQVFKKLGVMDSDQQPPGGAQAAPASAAPPQAAIDMLRKNPALAPAFQQKYGISPQQYLGQ